MLNKRISLIALGILSTTHAMANDQAESKGFVEDSSLKVLLRNAYINRDYKDGNQDKAEWGQAAIGTFSSGFTQGTVGVGVDAFGLYALRLDGGKGRSGAGGIDFFKQGDSGNAADDLSKFGAAVKFRVSNTVLAYGDQMPALPVLSYDNSRLLPESYTGTLITSKEIKGLELNAGRFTAESRKSAEGRDSGGLKSINVLGGSYQFTEQFKASLYASDVEDVLKKQYVNANYVFPLAKDQSLTLDFNGYRTKLDNSYVRENNVTGDDNKIWSLAATFATGPHSFTLAHQRSTGDSNLGYAYGGYQREQNRVGDGGNTIYLANSYWSDFNAEDERSWQLGYGLDFTTFGVPGLTYNVAYVRGDNITTSTSEGGTEREIFNQFKYVVQSGPAKDLSVRLRSSVLRVSQKSSEYNVSGNELRVFVDYPINVF
ncbi:MULTISPECIES: OprD family porin [unclassified Pseudomonas]|uniref:OprD family porin n=1 Tax=unclassified Pseudomonas TaxID=196821 RepID=UPI0008715837|nr:MULTISPECIES: OprD family porin [unclassified Pseudomonas]SCW52229.1 outer membrane porin, OprD family [Pseudomonas sp. NFACC05-1]SCZ35059.1 outer membrane porin, OprD family [Pseudomonas sp. NFACC44-2]SDA82794.1 outer membrane porin, OprD family [Pseudomonas sp. NFACC51]SDB26797.1 outer membrane porin, OprD family [Pseudomonas sp. NFACC17-2]SDW77284.1 outer membrane porin, OprD family [Pseudomonas sp. NFACC08-1]